MCWHFASTNLIHTISQWITYHSSFNVTVFYVGRLSTKLSYCFAPHLWQCTRKLRQLHSNLHIVRLFCDARLRHPISFAFILKYPFWWPSTTSEVGLQRRIERGFEGRFVGGIFDKHYGVKALRQREAERLGWKWRQFQPLTCLSQTDFPEARKAHLDEMRQKRSIASEFVKQFEWHLSLFPCKILTVKPWDSRQNPREYYTHRLGRTRAKCTICRGTLLLDLRLCDFSFGIWLTCAMIEDLLLISWHQLCVIDETTARNHHMILKWT